MAAYDYHCELCLITEEHFHSMLKDPSIKCPKCKINMTRLVSGGSYIIGSGMKESISDHKEKEHTKKVKDPERALRSRKKAFGSESGSPSMKTDPMHIIKKGRTIGGQQKEVNRDEFIRAAAKDPLTVAQCKKIIDKQKQ